MSISASSVTLAAWSSSWWGFPAEAVKVYSLSYSSLGCLIAIQLREVQNSPESDAAAT